MRHKSAFCICSVYYTISLATAKKSLKGNSSRTGLMIARLLLPEFVRPGLTAVLEFPGWEWFVFNKHDGTLTCSPGCLFSFIRMALYPLTSHPAPALGQRCRELRAVNWYQAAHRGCLAFPLPEVPPTATQSPCILSMLLLQAGLIIMTRFWTSSSHPVKVLSVCDESDMG